MSNVQIFLEILKTLPVVFLVYFSTAILSMPLGILGALAYTSDNKIIKSIISLYTWMFRGTPLMLQLFFVYYGLPLVSFLGYKLTLDPIVAAIITFVINYAAYLIEIIRSGIESIDKGQHEASKVLGYTYWQKIRYIILPQSLRRVLPTLGNEAITLIKDTALISRLFSISEDALVLKIKQLINKMMR